MASENVPRMVTVPPVSAVRSTVPPNWPAKPSGRMSSAPLPPDRTVSVPNLTVRPVKATVSRLTPVARGRLLDRDAAAELDAADRERDADGLDADEAARRGGELPSQSTTAVVPVLIASLNVAVQRHRAEVQSAGVPR